MPRADDWPAYFEAMADKPPRETLVFALDRFDVQFGHGATGPTEAIGGDGVGASAGARPVCPCHPDAVGVALDLGCGEGRDTVELLRRRWCVLAIDSHPEAIARLTARAARERPESAHLLRTGIETFEELPMPAAMFDLVNASFAIPHVSPTQFAGLWARIAASIRIGGRFCGQFFGERDEWASTPDGVTRTFHTRAEVDEMLAGFEVELLDEVERPGKDAFGQPKRWHVFHVVATKRG